MRVVSSAPLSALSDNFFGQMPPQTWRSPTLPFCSPRPAARQGFGAETCTREAMPRALLGRTSAVLTPHDIGKLKKWQQQALKVYLNPGGTGRGCGGNEHRLAKLFTAWVRFLDMRRTEHDEAAEINARMGQASLTYHEPKKAFKSKFAEKHGAKHGAVRLCAASARLARLRAPSSTRAGRWPRARVR